MIRIGFAVSLLVVLSVAGLTGLAAAQLGGHTIVLGVAGPQSGGAAALGTEQRQAVEMAVDEKNASGGILGARVLLVAADDRDYVSIALGLAGSASSRALVAAEVAEAARSESATARRLAEIIETETEAMISGDVLP